MGLFRHLLGPAPWILDQVGHWRVARAGYLCPWVDKSKEHRRATWRLEKRYARWKSQVVRTRPVVLSLRISTVSLVLADFGYGLRGVDDGITRQNERPSMFTWLACQPAPPSDPTGLDGGARSFWNLATSGVALGG